jgi:hypothetical protein
METRAGSSKQCQLAGVGWGTEGGAEAQELSAPGAQTQVVRFWGGTVT